MEISRHILERHGHAHIHQQYMQFVRSRGLKSKATRQAREAERKDVLIRGVEAAGGVWNDGLMTERAKEFVRCGAASDQREVQRLVRESMKRRKALEAARGDPFAMINTWPGWGSGSTLEDEDEEDDEDDHEMKTAPVVDEIKHANESSNIAPAFESHVTSGMVHQLKILLKGSKPPIWRRVLLPSTSSLEDLHHIIQTAFEWCDCHLHRFTVRGQIFSNDDVGEEGFVSSAVSEDSVTLEEVAGHERVVIHYEYDFGDCWDHLIVVEKLHRARDLEHEQYPVCVAGRNGGPSENSGGVHRYQERLRATSAASGPTSASLDSESEEDSSPSPFDIDAINARFAALDDSSSIASF